jgi:membrane protein DedA with SNARE-associated domain
MSIATIVGHFPYLGLFLLLILGGIGFPFPEDTTLILCGFLISHDVVKPVLTFIVVYSGILMSDFFLYFIGKKYGRAVIEHKRFRRFLTSERISILEDKFKKRGTIVILFGRHIVGLRAQIFLVAGIMRMSALKFLIADAVTAVFTIILMVGAGYMGGYSLQVVKRDVTKIEHLVVLLLIISLAIYLLFRYFKSR